MAPCKAENAVAGSNPVAHHSHCHCYLFVGSLVVRRRNAAQRKAVVLRQAVIQRKAVVQHKAVARKSPVGLGMAADHMVAHHIPADRKLAAGLDMVAGTVVAYPACHSWRFAPAYAPSAPDFSLVLAPCTVLPAPSAALSVIAAASAAQPWLVP